MGSGRESGIEWERVGEGGGEWGEGMSLDRKQPYVRFLLWVYLNIASGLLESGAGDLAHSR